MLFIIHHTSLKFSKCYRSIVPIIHRHHSGYDDNNMDYVKNYGGNGSNIEIASYSINLELAWPIPSKYQNRSHAHFTWSDVDSNFYSLLFSSPSSSKDVMVSTPFVLASGVEDKFQLFLEALGVGLINERLSFRSKNSFASLVNLKWQGREK
jgi:hypothetical protein